MEPISNELLDKYADYYTSEFVTKNLPWIHEIPFHEWLERELRKEVEKVA